MKLVRVFQTRQTVVRVYRLKNGKLAHRASPR
jgi:hypothetical protein